MPDGTRSAPEEDHHRVIAAALRPPPDWRRPPGRPRSTWLRVIDDDVRPQNFVVHTAWRKAKDTDTWHQVVSQYGNALLGVRHQEEKKKMAAVHTVVKYRKKYNARKTKSTIKPV